MNFGWIVTVILLLAAFVALLGMLANREIPDRNFFTP